MDNHFYSERDDRKYYTAGAGKPPIFAQAIIDKKCVKDYDFFALTDTYIDWSKEDDWERLEPLIDFLATWGDELIMSFDDMMSELLYQIDTYQIAKAAYKKEKYISYRDFLPNRCIALINGKSYYTKVLKRRTSLKCDREFSAILEVPRIAWSRRHKVPLEQYNHITSYKIESRSNVAGWEDEIAQS